MRFSLQREVFLKPLAQVVNVVERRQTLPVLANLLVQVKDGQLSLTGTDLEVEMVSRVLVDDAQDGETTIPARKLFEIIRALPDGSKVTDKTLAGKPFAIFFGFTRCPEVCPTTLARMASLRRQLGKDGDKFEIVFVSVDPEHDKPADIGSYISLFRTPILGLTGTAKQLATIQKGYGVYVKKVTLEGGDYTIDHTAAIFLMDAQGKFVTTIDYHESDKVALEKLRRIIA